MSSLLPAIFKFSITNFIRDLMPCNIYGFVFIDIMFFVDAMTSFGAIPLDMKHTDFLLSNSCKSLQGVPGIAFVIARKNMLEK